MEDKVAEALERMEEVELSDEVGQLDPVGICQHEDCNAVIRAHTHYKEGEEGVYITTICPKCGKDPGVVDKLRFGDE